ncbi:YybH family protein [Kribbella sp. NPDC002412]
MTNEQEVRTLIENWVTAVHAGDLDTVLADHSPDIVMFDVPPPYDGVRGVDAYRETWPGFFEWQRSGASFALESLEVTAGADVAFAFALLRCGTPDELAANPASRLRLTIGLRRENGRWTVTHEHHSFPHDDVPPAAAEDQIRALMHRWTADTSARNLDALMQPIAEDVVSYEIDGEYAGKPAVREVCKTGLESTPLEITFTTPNLTVESSGDLAVAYGIDHVEADGTDTESRSTRVFKHTATGWQMIHQHLSYPAK